MELKPKPRAHAPLQQETVDLLRQIAAQALIVPMLLTVVAIVVILPGCFETDRRTTSPTSPISDEPEEASCLAPSSNNAAVTAKPPGTCPPTGPCIATWSVSQALDVFRSDWRFPGCQPSESTSFTGTDALICPGPGTYRWENKVCSTPQQDDPTDLCCRPVSSTVTFADI